MAEHQLLYLSRADVEKVALDMSTILKLLEEAFKEKGHGKVEMPPKPGIHTMPDAFIHAMPAFIPSLHSAGIKWVSGYPENFKRGLPYITGLLILNDDETGIPYAVMDCTWITAYRTGAATGLAAKYLARPNSEVAGILACGVQGRTNLEALACLFPLKRVYAYDILPEAQAKFVEEMKAKFKFEIVPAKGPKEAVMESDLVVTAGPILKHPTPTIEKDWLKPGGFRFRGGFRLLLDWSGDGPDGQDQHGRPCPVPILPVERLLPSRPRTHMLTWANSPPARNRDASSDKERTLAINLGLAMDDMAIAPEIYRRAREKGVGTWLPLYGLMMFPKQLTS